MVVFGFKSLVLLRLPMSESLNSVTSCAFVVCYGIWSSKYCCNTPFWFISLSCATNFICVQTSLHIVAGVLNSSGTQEILLNRPHTHESTKQICTSGFAVRVLASVYRLKKGNYSCYLLIRSASPGTTKWLLSNYGPRALAVQVKVTSRIP
jgi:hypothetical protein